MRKSCLVLIALLTASCAAKKPLPPPPPDPNIQRIADADALAGIGCYRCLKEAAAIYEPISAARADVLPRLFDTYLLLALRQKELGLADAATLQKARETLERLPAGTREPLFLTIAESIPPNPSISAAAQAEFVATRFLQMREQTPGWKASLAPAVDTNPIAAYLMLALECDARFGGSAEPPPNLDRGGDSVLIEYRRSICRGREGDRAATLVAREPRFVELHFFIGLRALAAGRLVTAEKALAKAYDALADLPALTLTMANLYLALEETETSLDFYEKTLSLVADHREALLGKGKANSYLRRHEPALVPIERLIALGRTHLAEAHYWGAYNLFGLKRLDEAWKEALLAKAMWVNGAVYKLAGLIAHARADLDEAELNFLAAWKLSESDCEAGLYLGGVRTERSQWRLSAPVSAKAADCYVGEIANLKAEVARLEQSDDEPDRKKRQMARRERDILEQQRLEATAAFQAAAAYYNMGIKEEAAKWATRAAQHEAFRERAEKIIGR